MRKRKKIHVHCTYKQKWLKKIVNGDARKLQSKKHNIEKEKFNTVHGHTRTKK